MGLCQSTALKVHIINPDGEKKSYSFSMKKMRTFQTMGDVLNFTNIDLRPSDKIYARSPYGLDELSTQSQFQIRDLIVKNNSRSLRYQIRMESLY